MTNIKSVKVLTRPGLNILAPAQCKKCRHIITRAREEMICRLWAFPETKWHNETGCSDYQPLPDGSPV